MGAGYAYATVDLLVAEYGGLTQSELLKINDRSYHAVPFYLQNRFKDIRSGMSGRVDFKDGKYVLKGDREKVRNELQEDFNHRLVVEIAFFCWNYKPSFWMREIEKTVPFGQKKKSKKKKT